jgi:hypothetical protein
MNKPVMVRNDSAEEPARRLYEPDDLRSLIDSDAFAAAVTIENLRNFLVLRDDHGLSYSVRWLQGYCKAIKTATDMLIAQREEGVP